MYFETSRIKTKGLIFWRFLRNKAGGGTRYFIFTWSRGFTYFMIWVICNVKNYIAPGKPTKRKPKPKPAPCRVVTPTEGDTASSTANTTAAKTANVATSSNGKARFGIKIAAAAITRPSIKYLMTRLMISANP